MKLFTLLCLLFFLSTTNCIQATIDVETAPTLRTRSYSTGKYKNIVVFSAARTGSSLVYNIFKFLFEDDSTLLVNHIDFDVERVVRKTHSLNRIRSLDKENFLFIFTFRHPLQASISNYRITTDNKKDNKAFAKKLINTQSKYLTFSEEMEKEGLNMIRLKYEDFVDKIDFIFDKIEDYFQISIDPEDKELMRKCYSKENIKACTQHLKVFDEYLPISGFHGSHIKSKKYKPPDEFLYWLRVFMNDFKELFQNYGYFLDDRKME